MTNIINNVNAKLVKKQAAVTAANLKSAGANYISAEDVESEYYLHVLELGDNAKSVKDFCAYYYTCIYNSNTRAIHFDELTKDGTEFDAVDNNADAEATYLHALRAEEEMEELEECWNKRLKAHSGTQLAAKAVRLRKLLSKHSSIAQAGPDVCSFLNKNNSVQKEREAHRLFNEVVAGLRSEPFMQQLDMFGF